MNFLRNQNPVQPQRDEFGFDDTESDSRVQGSRPLAANDAAFESFQTLHKQPDYPISKDKDLEKLPQDSVEWTGKYAKYADGPPDGGWKAWTVILGTSMATCAALGYVTAWGIFQEYYGRELLSHETSSTIAWIGSVQYTLIFFPGFITGRLLDVGFFRMPVFIASVVLVVCTLLIAECKEYWQFFLAQGLGVGMASSFVFGPLLGIVGHWFSKRRGLALGVTAIGASVGGVAFPVAAQNLIPQVGFKWTMRVIAFLLLFTLGIANLTLDRRTPPISAKGGLLNLSALKNPAYAVYCTSGTFTFLGLYTSEFGIFALPELIFVADARPMVLTYIPVTAVEAGISKDFAFYYVAIVNGSSAFGRISAGFLGDRIGALNVIIPFTVLSAVTTFVWPFITTKGGLVGIAVVYGFSYGTYISLLPVPAMAMGPMSAIGQRTGMFLSFAALGALGGPPISGAINTATGGFKAVGYWGGAILLFSVCLLLLARHLHLGKLMGKF